MSKEDNFFKKLLVVSKEKYIDECNANGSVFSKKELAELQGRSKQTAAGFLALKRSLIDLISLTDNINISEKEIELSHKKNGAPIISKIPTKLCKDKFKISLSHSQNNIAALSVKEVTHEKS